MASAFTQSVVHCEPAFDFVGAHFQCEHDRYGGKNSNGFVNFGSAQNFLHPDLLSDRLASVDDHPNDSHYQPFEGTSDCRTAIADYLQSQAGVPVPANTIVVGNGIISVLEALTVALLDEGDSVLVPTPVFPGLVAAMSLRVKSKVELMPMGPAADFRLTPAALESHLHRLQIAGKRVRAILLCSPGNPIGQVFTQSELQEFLDVAELFDCSLIVDEVYAGSVFEGRQFCSAVSLRSKNTYVLGGLSKDFGLAGHATGWLQSLNDEVMKAVAKQSHFFRLPGPVQRVIASLLQPTWRTDYLKVHRERLTETERFVRRELESFGIPVTEAQAGLCLWLDLRSYLPSNDAVGEMALYERLLNEHRVHISPGSGFKTSSTGFFRICFSLPRATLYEGLTRLFVGLRTGTDSSVAANRSAPEVSGFARKAAASQVLQRA